MNLETIKELIDDKFEKNEDILIKLSDSFFEKKIIITTKGNSKLRNRIVILEDGPFWYILKHYKDNKLAVKVKIHSSQFSNKTVEDYIIITIKFYILERIKLEKEFREIYEKHSK